MKKKKITTNKKREQNKNKRWWRFHASVNKRDNTLKKYVLRYKRRRYVRVHWWRSKWVINKVQDSEFWHIYIEIGRANKCVYHSFLICFPFTSGAFFIPYCIALAFLGIPIFLLELAIGQYSSSGPFTCWKYSPIFTGKS